MKTIIIFTILLVVSHVNAQSKALSISGYILDFNTKEPLYGVKVKAENNTEEVVTSADGKFKLELFASLPLKLIVDAPDYVPAEYVVEKEDDVITLFLNRPSKVFNEIVVTGRRRSEDLIAVPIPITVLSSQTVENTGSFNVNRLKELVPSVQLYSSNARNTTLNIRGLGSTFGLTNDGIDPGVGFYIDGVYHARPAATALDFVDVDQIEILRGPQGSLFGKNTTAGAFNITSKKPSETPGARVELSYGNYNYIQAKSSVTGKLANHLSTRLSFSGTQRQGTIFNPNDQQHYNGLNNVGVKGQLLYQPNEQLEFHLIADYNKQSPDGSALVVAGVTPTLRSSYRQYYTIIEDLGYEKPIIDPFSRKVYTNTPYRHDQEAGGVSFNVNYKIGKATLTSTTAWRFWDWDPTNDRDFTEVAALTKSQAPSHHNQYSQEIRLAGNILEQLSGTVGVYALYQELETSPYHEEEVGPDQWRFVQTSNSGNQALYSTPGLLDNYGIRTYSLLTSLSTAAFGQLDWKVYKGLHVIGGLRYNYDEKSAEYDRKTYGGLQTTDPVLLNLKKAVYSDQSFSTSVNNTNLSGNLTLSYQFKNNINVFGTYTSAYKPIGINLGGLPTTASGDPDLSLATVKPEFVQHTEFGIKSKPIDGLYANLTVFNTDIKDYQTSVQSPQLGVNRGYLANAEKVKVKGVEVDANYRLKNFLTLNVALTYTDGKYVKFTNAPLPLEETGQTTTDANGNTVQRAFKDVSGTELPGISKWNISSGIELSKKGGLFGKNGRYFIAADFSYRSDFSSSTSSSAVLRIDGYALLNPRIGFKSGQFTAFIWSRNVTGTNYFEQLQAAAGNSGLYAGVLGDPRTYGITLRFNY